MLWLRRTRLRLARLRGGGAGDEGFTLIEVLVAIVILSIVGLVAARLLSSSITTTSNFDKKQTAVAIATMQMEAVRGADAGPSVKQAANGLFPGTSALFNGRPMTEQLAQFDTTSSSAAAAVADVLANTYPEWDSTVAADSQFAAPDATIPPSGVESVIESDGGDTVYRDATGARVYLTSQVDSFGTAIWSTDAAHTSLIRATYSTTSGPDGSGAYHYTNVADPSATLVTTNPGTVSGGVRYLYQSTVRGYPSGQITLNGTAYTTTVILGSCFVPTAQANLAQTVNGTCGKVPGVAVGTAFASPALPSGIVGYTKLVRVIVVVQWAGGGAAGGWCTAEQPCSYALTSEFLPSILDLLWEPTS